MTDTSLQAAGGDGGDGPNPDGPPDVKSPPPAQPSDALRILDGLPDGFYAVDREWRLVAMNTAAERCFHLDRKAALGQPLWTVLPQLVGSEFERRYRVAMAGGQPDEFVSVASVNHGLFIEVRVQPTLDGLGITFRDVSGRRREDEASRATATHLRLALEAGRMAVWEHDFATDTLRGSPALNRLLGYPPDAIPDLNELRARYHPGEGERLRAAGMAAMASGDRFFEVEYRFYRLDGELRWYWMRAEITLDDQGGPARTFGVLLDITERKQTEEALREREAELSAALDAGRLAVFDYDHVRGVMKPSARLSELYGYPPLHLLTIEEIRARYHPEDQPAIFERVRRDSADPSIRAFRWLLRLLLPDGEVRWVEGVGEYVRAEDGTIVQSRGVLQDVTEPKRWEEHQRLLINELNHRVRNTLAVVQGLAQQSLRADGTAQDGLARFEARLEALSSAHTLLTRQNWEPASLREVAVDAIGAAAGAAAERVRIAGPGVLIPPQTAVSLSLAFHELCTNAIKYGSLSTAEGRIELHWALAGPDGAAVLRLQWREFAGPPVAVPARSGFGTRLLERGLARELGGTVELKFEPAGLVCVLEAPLPSLGGPPVGG